MRDAIGRASVRSECRAPAGDTVRHPRGPRHAMSVLLPGGRDICRGPSRPCPYHLSSLDRTQQGPGPGDMSSCGPGP
ncbi:hypothetical protein DESPIGER_2343 [Desulfovibrio piger]|uniref:Uncharacterized protein n=1 Tax=Desulfovibrio piger TaxID=901 RepID=A0A1K1LHH4_9BACT|nr:hypothetical protein DESPIGER_2343 [Desulfovibrio piger]